MTAIDWGTSSLSFAGVQRVYTRQRWADSWTLQSNIWCEEATWSLLPAMPSASFILRYGRVLPHGSSSWTTQAKLAIGGYYIKAEFDCEDGTIIWVGFIDQLADEQGGITSSVPYGTQRFVALSMAQVLAYEYMTRSKWDDEPNTTLRWSGSAIAFNQGGKPNRTFNDNADGAETYVFCPTVPKNWTADSPWTKAKFWSSRDIASYLMKYAVPTDADDDPLITFRIDNITAIPDWDRPTIETEGKSVLSILEELVNASKLLQFSVKIDETTTPDTVVFTVHSLASTALTLADSNTHPANSDTLTIVTTAAQDTNVSTQYSVTSFSNQVVVKGAKRETCFTAAIAKSGEAFLPGWKEVEEDAYNDAATGEAGYSGLTTTQKKHVNQIVRSKHKLNDVFKTFVLNPYWDFFVDFEQVFTAIGGGRYYPWWNAITVLPSLPFKEGLPYDTTVITEDDHQATVEYRPPYVLFKRPGTSQYLQAEKMADGVDPKFSVSVGLAKFNNGITLDVYGQHQHAIAKTDFVAADVDTESIGDFDYIDAKLTVSLSDDRFAEYAYPLDADLPTTVDAIRRKIYYAGESYKRIAVISGSTIVDVDNTGATEAIDSGNLTLSDSVYTLVDDTGKLESIGKVAAAWYLVPRQIMRLSTARPSALAFVGQLVTNLNTGTGHAATINTVISEIRLQTPQSDRSEPVHFSIVTAMGELDPLQFVPPAPISKVAKVN